MPKLLPGRTPIEKVLFNTRREGDCLRWTGAHTSAGYGRLRVNGKMLAVHRIVYEAFCGPIPDGLEPDHLCRVRDCVNLDHLEAVTHVENMRRSSNPFRPGRSHCIRGHEFTEENTSLVGRYRRCRACHRARNREYKSRTRRAWLGFEESNA